MKELNKIYNEDCLTGMQDIDDKSIDAIICDLPYEVLNKGNKNAQWDTVIPFEKLWEQYNRIIKDNGAIVLFCQGMFTARLMMSNASMWRYNLVWDKNRATGFLNASRMPLRSHEDIAVFYKSLPTYNPQMEKCLPSERSHSRGSGVHKKTNQCYGEWTETPTKISDEKFPKSIIRIDKEHSSDTWHPTQKPVALLEYLIRTYTNPGELVLDNCMGSGTTAVACIRQDRNFIGFEMNQEYCEKASRRVKEEMLSKESKLF